MQRKSRFNKYGQSKTCDLLFISTLRLAQNFGPVIWKIQPPHEIHIWLDEAARRCRICSLLEAHAFQWSCFLLGNPRQSHLLCNEIRQHAHTFLLCCYPLKSRSSRKCLAEEVPCCLAEHVDGHEPNPTEWLGKPDTLTHTLSRQCRCTVCLVGYTSTCLARMKRLGSHIAYL